MKTILMVEDEYLLSMVFQMLLEQHGYRVIITSNGVEALDHLKENVPDLILTDNMMPYMDGIQMLLRVKENPLLKSIPVILMSAAYPPSGYKGLWDVFVSKLDSSNDLLSSIRQLLGE